MQGRLESGYVGHNRSNRLRLHSDTYFSIVSPSRNWTFSCTCRSAIYLVGYHALVTTPSSKKKANDAELVIFSTARVLERTPSL